MKEEFIALYTFLARKKMSWHRIIVAPKLHKYSKVLFHIQQNILKEIMKFFSY